MFSDCFLNQSSKRLQVLGAENCNDLSAGQNIAAYWLTLVVQLDGAKLVLLVPAESDRDLVAPAAHDESFHQHRLVGKDEGFSSACVLHRHLLSLQQAHIQHLWGERPTRET